MKTTKRILFLIILLLAIQLPAQTPTNAIPTLGMTVGNMLSLRNPAIQQTNTLTIALGEGIRTESSETYQATVIHALYAVRDNLSVGARFELDTLGSGGNTVAGISIGGEARYETDNLYASGIAGYHRDVEADKRYFEFGIGLGAYITPSFSMSTEFLLGLKNFTDDDSLSRAVVVTANWTF
jgi:hypothetical protein